ncbi:hypothetical protein E4T49_01354 [Aureobasidium sp. EXF-10728]|nr:hypothetical protein E4T49_01354 [Aureobasidium sp. EXF-10728]
MSVDQPQQQFTAHGNNTQAALLVPATITLALSLLLYGVRIRARHSSPLVWTDATITASLTLAIVDFFVAAVGCHHGLGRHTAFVDSARVVKARYLGFLAQPICMWSVCLAKCSIAWTALGLRPDREWRWVFCWILFVQVVCTIAGNVIQVVQCSPTSALWNDSVEAQCWPPERTQLAGHVTLGFGVITSILLSLTPITLVKSANRSIQELVALGLLVGVGLFVIMSSVANMVYLRNYRMTEDPLRDLIAPTTWWQIEQNFSIMAGLAIHLQTPYEALLARCGLISSISTESSPSHRLNHLEHGSQTLKSLKTTIPWGQVYDSMTHLPSIVKTTEVVHSTELVKDDGLHFGTPARRPSWL